MTDFRVAANGERLSTPITSSWTSPVRLPDGICHAVATGSHRTVCGIEVSGLQAFPELPFGRALVEHCPSCTRSLQRP